MDLTIVPTSATAIAPARTSRDQRIIEMWVADRPVNTRRAYRRAAKKLLEFSGRTLAELTLTDLQDFSAHLESSGMATGSRRATLAAVKSLFSFAAGIGYLAMNVAAAVRLRKPKNRLNERILSEDEVRRLIAAAGVGRDRFLVELLYRSAARIEEAVNLHWRDLQPDGDGGVLTLYGKGEKTRAIRFEANDWEWIRRRRPSDAANDDPIFASIRGRRLSQCQAWRIVKRAANAAGLRDAISPHWLRHAHATHAIARGADPRTVQESLGHSSLQTTEGYIHARPAKSSGSFLPRFDQPTDAPAPAASPSTAARPMHDN